MTPLDARTSRSGAASPIPPSPATTTLAGIWNLGDTPTRGLTQPPSAAQALRSPTLASPWGMAAPWMSPAMPQHVTDDADTFTLAVAPSDADAVIRQRAPRTLEAGLAVVADIRERGKPATPPSGARTPPWLGKLEECSPGLCLKLPALTLVEALPSIIATGRSGLELFDHDANVAPFTEVQKLAQKLAGTPAEITAAVRRGMETKCWAHVEDPTYAQIETLLCSASHRMPRWLGGSEGDRQFSAAWIKAIMEEPSTCRQLDFS